MKKQEQTKNFYTLDEIQDEFVGKRGTPKREAYEIELKLELLGGEIKDLRKKQNLTQTELGKRIGVKKAQISRIENNTSNVTLVTISKVFKALGNNLSLKIEPV